MQTTDFDFKLISKLNTLFYDKQLIYNRAYQFISYPVLYSIFLVLVVLVTHLHNDIAYFHHILGIVII